MIVRTATKHDVGAVVDIEERGFGRQAWSAQAVAEDVAGASTARVVLVAVDAACVVGYASMLVAGDVADLDRVVVSARNRRRGVGGALVAAAVDEARMRACTRVMLEVAAGSQPALALYLGHGFAEVNRRRRYYAAGADAIVLALDLGAPDG